MNHHMPSNTQCSVTADTFPAPSHAMLNYARPLLRPPANPAYAFISLAFAVTPIAAMPFAPIGRALDFSVGVIMLGTLLAPFNLVADCFLLRRYRGQKMPWGLTLVSLILSAGMTLLLGIIVASIAVNGPPC